MFPRLTGQHQQLQQDDDIFAGATTTVRSAFPNSRLDSLANHNYQSHGQSPPHGAHHPPAAIPPNPTQQPSSTFGGGNHQLLSPYDPAIERDFLATASTIFGDAAGAAASGGVEAIATATNSGGGGNSGANLLPANDDDWWSNAIEEDTFDSPLAFDASENGLWNGRFVPPPPRPPFLDESVAADGLTTCDLCTWAWQRNAYSLDGSIDASGEIGWAFTLIVVSILSALIGAIVMVVVLRCRRIKSANANVWLHFKEAGFQRATCNYCQTSLSIAGGSHGNLNRHMKIKHPLIPLIPQRQEACSSAEAVETTNIESGLQKDLPSTSLQVRSQQQHITQYIRRPVSVRKVEEIDKQVLKMVAKGHHALKIVEEPEFKKLIHLVSNCPGYSLPARHTLSKNLLPKVYTELLETIKEEVRSASAICLTTDGWTSKTNASYMAVTAHFINFNDNKRSILNPILLFNDRDMYRRILYESEKHHGCRDPRNKAHHHL
ncbi:uncharacterized protein [Musca autumnalis]|uniref:uncharacterized protein n=1 Tax=Musca autumnalis TaxID=221902 RepID=UPI003CF6B895